MSIHVAMVQTVDKFGAVPSTCTYIVCKLSQQRYSVIGHPTAKYQKVSPGKNYYERWSLLKTSVTVQDIRKDLIIHE